MLCILTAPTILVGPLVLYVSCDSLGQSMTWGLITSYALEMLMLQQIKFGFLMSHVLLGLFLIYELNLQEKMCLYCLNIPAASVSGCAL